MAGSIITIDQLTEQTVLAKKDWIAVLNATSKKTGKASFATVIELLKADFYTKADILDLLRKGQSGGAFDGSRTITQGSYAGTTPGGTSVVEFLDNVFYADLAPAPGLSAENTPRQFGSSTDVILHYSVTTRSNPVQTIVVDGNAIPLDMSGFPALSGTVNASVSPNANQTFHMSATDTKGLAGTTQAGVEFKHKRFWFTSATDLTALSDADVSKRLIAQQAEFADGRGQTRTFNPAGEYIYFAWLADYGQAQFVVNGLGDTDFIQKTFPFTNSEAYTTSFILVRKGTKLSNAFTVQVK